MDWYYHAYATIVNLQKFLKAELADVITHTAQTGVLVPSLIVLAVVLGMIHALTPGHGKSVMLAYFIGREATVLAGFGVASKVALAHITAAVVLVTIFGRAISMWGRPSGAAAWLQIISFALIAVMGCIYLVQALRQSHTSHRSPAALPFAVGVLPCPLTMLVVGQAFVTGAYSVGLILAALMGLGAAFTIGCFAAFGVLARRGLFGIDGVHSLSLTRVVFGLEIGSSFFILGLGLAGLISIAGYS